MEKQQLPAISNFATLNFLMEKAEEGKETVGIYVTKIEIRDKRIGTRCAPRCISRHMSRNANWQLPRSVMIFADKPGNRVEVNERETNSRRSFFLTVLWPFSRPAKVTIIILQPSTWHNVHSRDEAR